MMQDLAIEKLMDIEPTPCNPRNSEGAILELADGRLMLAYSRFTGGAWDDDSADIAARFSYDRGKTWDAHDVILIPNEGEENIMSVSLLRLEKGEIALFYIVRNSPADSRLCMRKSYDEGKTWGDKTLCIPHDGYFVVNNDRVIRLAGGRLVVPTAFHPLNGSTMDDLDLRGHCTCCYSDDTGITWHAGGTELAAPGSVISVHPDSLGRTVTDGVFQEPGVVELKDGRLMMWMRTNMGCQYRSYSTDGGETWSEAEPSDLISPVSPASIKRIPSTGDLLVLYNDHSGRFPFAENDGRAPLVSAISKDDGVTWQNHRLVESDLSGWYCYSLISFVGYEAILGYCVHGLNSLRLSSVPIEWFYIE